MTLTDPEPPSALHPEAPPAGPRHTVALFVENPHHRNLLEHALVQLDLPCTVFASVASSGESTAGSALPPERFEAPADRVESSADRVEAVLTGFESRSAGFDVLIADAPTARRLEHLLHRERFAHRQLRPALVVVLPAGDPSTPTWQDPCFDAVLVLPASPELLAAQLSIALYAHRASAARHRSAAEELSLHRRIFRSVTSGISVADAQLPDLPLLYVNPAFEAMTGYTLEEVQGRNCRFLQGADTDQPALTGIRDAISGRHETVSLLRNYRKDGTPFWNEFAISPVRDFAGRVTHFVGIQMDVTERVQFELALRESEKLAAVGRLASSIAHEINNPLEAVMNLLYLATQTLPDLPETAEAALYLRQADIEVQRIKLVTAQSLRFYKQSNRAGAVSAHQLLDATIDVYGSKLTNYGIAVERRHRPAPPVVCLASEIRQVVSNLLANAIDATMAAERGRLVVRSRETIDWPTGRRGVVLTIADTGKGMSPETRANLYKAFYTTKGAAGNGLGLWISAEIILRHQGRLAVRSRQVPHPSGTVFRLFLPFEGPSSLVHPSTPIAQPAS